MKLRTISSAVAALIFVTSCDNDVDQVAPPKNRTTTMIDRKSALPYRIEPTAPDVLKVSFYNSVDHRGLKSASLLGPDGTKLASVEIKDANVPPTNIYTGTFKYSFDPTIDYRFSIESEVVKDTAFLYSTETYHHIFKSSFTYERLTSLSSWYDYDIDPLRKSVVIIDNVALGAPQSGFVLKRISTADFSVSTITNVPVAYNFVRALSGNDILTYTRTWQNHFLKGDSAALVRVDLTTGVQQFVDWTSGDYKRVSRVVNGHILYTNPIFSSHTSTLLDLSSGERQLFPEAQLNPFSIREGNFDNIYAGETIYDWSSRQFVDKLHIRDPSSIVYEDDQAPLTFVIDNRQNADMSYPRFTVAGRLLVYKGTTISSRQDYEDGAYPWLGRIIRVKDNKVIYYKTTTFAFRPIVGGYYALDLQTGKSALLHTDNFDRHSENLMLDDSTILSIRGADGAYKITIP